MDRRLERVESALVKLVSQIVQQELHNANIGFVTFYAAKASPDLRNATVLYSLMGSDEEKARTELSLEASRKQIKKLVNNELQLRYAIEIELRRCDNFGEDERIQSLFKQIDQERKKREARSE